jgi:hypothetical protein
MNCPVKQVDDAAPVGCIDEQITVILSGISGIWKPKTNKIVIIWSDEEKAITTVIDECW